MNLYEQIRERYPCRSCPLRRECSRNSRDEWMKWFRLSWKRVSNYWERKDAR